MGLAHSPGVVTDGLIFYYDMNNVKKSWRGAPTTNLKSNPDFSNGTTTYNAYVSSAPTLVSVTDFPESMGRQKTVLQCTSAAAPGGGGNSGGMVFANPTLTTGLSYTISFWARIISHTSATNTFSNQNGSGDNSNFAFSRTITNTWTKYSNTTNSLNLFKTQWYIWTNLNSAIWQYADFQIEQNSFATPFVNGTRSNTQAIVDLTNNNTITATSLTYNSDGTFSFNGSSNYAQIPLTLLGSQRNTFSIEIWAEFVAVGNSQLIFNAKGQGLYPRIFKNSSEKIFVQYRPTGTTTSITSTSSVSLNQKYHIVFTYDSVLGGILYINGIVEGTNSGTVGSHEGGTSGNINIGHDSNLSMWANGKIYIVKLYDRVLTAAEVAQNFQALRGRYGI